MTKEFQENGYVTVDDLIDRIYRLQVRCIISSPAIMSILTLERFGDWSDFVVDNQMMVVKQFRIYTGCEDQFNWVNDKFELACKSAGYPFLKKKWDWECDQPIE
jgi:hypothetical protein